MMTGRTEWYGLPRAVLMASVVLVMLSGGPAWAVVTFTTDTLIDDGDMTYDGEDIVVDGCTLTINGQHTFSSLAVLDGGTVTHGAGVLGFDLSLTGDLTVDAGGSISADGQGYGSSAGPGQGGEAASFTGGGGYGGAGGDGQWSSGGPTYGSLTEPVDLGSGGGRDGCGGSGGGALRLTVDGTLTVEGDLRTNGNPGGCNSSGGGSGGSIWVTAGALGGTGVIAATGGNGILGSGGGGGGRIAIYCHGAMSFPTDNIALEGGTGYESGESGTIFLSVPPHIVSHSPHHFVGSIDHIDLTFNVEIDASTFTVDDIEIVGPEGPIQADPPTLVPGQRDNTWRVAFPSQSASGEYHAFVGPHIEDAIVGNEMNQDWDEIAGEDPDDIYDAAFTTVNVQTLTRGVALPDSFDASGELGFYSIAVIAGKDLEIQLDDLDDTGVNELYATFEQIPTRSAFEYRSTTQPVADQSLRISGTRAGKYYILAYAADVPDPGPSEFTMLAQYLPLSIMSVTPGNPVHRT